MDLHPLITIYPDILDGQPVFVGARVPIETLLDHLEEGVTLDKFLDDFPSVAKAKAIGLLEAAAAAV